MSIMSQCPVSVLSAANSNSLLLSPFSSEGSQESQPPKTNNPKFNPYRVVHRMDYKFSTIIKPLTGFVFLQILNKSINQPINQPIIRLLSIVEAQPFNSSRGIRRIFQQDHSINHSFIQFSSEQSEESPHLFTDH